jgi:hypothetical protein
VFLHIVVVVLHGRLVVFVFARQCCGGTVLGRFDVFYKVD